MSIGIWRGIVCIPFVEHAVFGGGRGRGKRKCGKIGLIGEAGYPILLPFPVPFCFEGVSVYVGVRVAHEVVREGMMDAGDKEEVTWVVGREDFGEGGVCEVKVDASGAARGPINGRKEA